MSDGKGVDIKDAADQHTSPDPPLAPADSKAPAPAAVTSPLPRLDDSSRWRASPSPRSPSPPALHLGPTSVRETREIPIPLTTPRTTYQPSQQLPSRPAASHAATSAGSATPRPEPPPASTPSPHAMSSSSPLSSPPSSYPASPPIHIPKIPPISPLPSLSPPLSLPAQLARGLEGKYVDEFGNVLDWEGHVLGRVEGDLPAMVGRPVSASGEVLAADGSVAGHIAENDTLVDHVPEPRALDDLAGTGLRVDHLGNLLDAEGRVIGRLNNPQGTQGHSRQNDGQQSHPHADSPLQPPSSRPSAPRPSEIYLDIKSTMDGIQIILKIPTVFNRDGSLPQVHVS